MNNFRANGKLLISGEYAVLDGALAFAIPTKSGQTLEVDYLENSENPVLIWDAFLHDRSLWFSAEFELKSLRILNFSDEELTRKLKELFQAIEQLNPGFFKDQTRNIHCKTQLEFSKDWGLGSSSTLIHLLAQFSETDAFELNKLTFKTSGYDIACAGMNSPILYQNMSSGRKIEPVMFRSEFSDRLYFVHLNQKQDTQIHVSKNYRDLPKDTEWLNGISSLSFNILNAKSLDEFETLMNLHEEMISSKLNLPKVKDLYFTDYKGSVKSLGAWGGDFLLVTARDGFEAYFKSRGYNTIYSFSEMIIHN